MTPATVLRPAVSSDASDLAILLDAASRRLVSYLWSGMAVSGQSVFEVGRARIRMNTQSPSYYANWQVAELDGQVAGGLAGYVMDDPYDLAIADEYPAAFRPMFELEAVAAGTWYLQVVALFAEYRGLGLGQRLLDRADFSGTASGTFSDHPDHGKLQHACDRGLSTPWLPGVGPPDLHPLRRHR